MTGQPTDARRAAVEVLLKIQQQGGYSNIVLEELLCRDALNAADRALTARLVYGVTERRLTLDYLLNRLSTTPVVKMEPAVREILRVGAYQLVYMDNVPAFAAISQSVELTRRFGHARLTGFVNGVLRAVQRNWNAELEALPPTDKGLEQRYSCPRAWIRLWRQAYGEAALAGLLDNINEEPPAYIRVNTVQTTTTAFSRRLTAAGIDYSPVEGLPDALKILSPAALSRLPEEWRTQFYFQDIASQWCCRALDARPGERIADVCAAPGGKSFTTAQYMENTGVIEAADIYEQKCATVARRAAALGLTCVTAVRRDATKEPPAEIRESFDRVICDAPCSGLGVMRRKPEIRYKSPEEFDDLPALQRRILSNAALLVRPGGVLQYSTCTLRPQENEEVAAAFLDSHPDFSPRRLPLDACFAAAGLPASHQITLFPHIHAADGFYMAGFIKAT